MLPEQRCWHDIWQRTIQRRGNRAPRRCRAKAALRGRALRRQGRCGERGVVGVTGVTATGYELHNFAIPSQRPTFLTGTAPPLAGAHQAVDLVEASFSEAGTLSRGEARLRRRATRALDSVPASEVLASMRSTARWVGGSGGQVRNRLRPAGASRYHGVISAYVERTFEAPACLAVMRGLDPRIQHEARAACHDRRRLGARIKSGRDERRAVG